MTKKKTGAGRSSAVSSGRSTKSTSKKTDRGKTPEKKSCTNEIVGVALICLGCLFALAAYTNIGAWIIVRLRLFILGFFGIAGYAAPVLLVAAGVLSIIFEKLSDRVIRLVMCVLGFVAMLSIIHICYSGKLDFANGSYWRFIADSYKAGYEQRIGAGALGSILSWPLNAVLGTAGCVCILAAVIIIAVIIVFGISLKKTGASVYGSVKRTLENRRSKDVYVDEDEPPFTDYEYEQPEWREPELPDSNEDEGFSVRNVYDTEDSGDYVPPARGKKTGRNKIEKITLSYSELDLQNEKPIIPKPIKERPVAEPEPVPVRVPVKEIRPEPERTPGLKIIGQDLTGKMEGKTRKKASCRLDVPDVSPQRVTPGMGAAASSPFSPVHEYPFAPVRPLEDEILPQEDAEEQYDGAPEAESDYMGTVERASRSAAAIRQAKPSKGTAAVGETGTPDIASAETKEAEYSYPPIDLLNKNKTTQAMQRAAKNETEANSRLLEQTLENFGVSAAVVNTERGPKVTRYELQPARGVKINRIVSLADEIKMNLAVSSVRIEAPIPGKAAVGIELPNKETALVTARDLIDTAEFRNQKSQLSFALGKDIMGNNIFADLSKMPHLLVAGTTGSGKSVCLNTVIMSLLYRTHPDEVKMMMIDPKRGVEMAKYNGIPHLITPVVTEPEKAAGALTWAVCEMMSRYNIMNSTGTRTIETHNNVIRSRGETPLPKLVIIIDEFADLMMECSKEVQDAVIRIAQLGRAGGIHLIIATQSPRANIFTGMIKANVPSRIALTVGSPLESRIIMDAMGAETLLGNGDMLFRPIGMNKPIRVQGCWISDEEIERVVAFLKGNESAHYDEGLESEIEKLAKQSGKKNKPMQNESADDGGFEDELTKQAIKTAVDYDGVSASMLQRRLRVGYARASRLVDELESLGVVGPADGSKPRQLLITREDYINMCGEDEDTVFGDYDE